MTKLSFFDEFHVISGVPVFVLDPDKATAPVSAGFHNEGNSGLEQRVGRNIKKISFSNNKNAITCCDFSDDGSRVVSGHNDGSAVIWSASHGTKLHESKNLHKLSPIADIQFLGDSNDIVMSCDFHGRYSMWNTKENVNRPVYWDCSPCWTVSSILGPKVRWPQFSSNGEVLLYPVTYFREGRKERVPSPEEKRTASFISDVEFHQECGLYIFESLQLRSHKAKPKTVLTVGSAGDADFEYAWGVFSPSTKGLLAGFNARPFGFVIIWPDYAGDLEEYQLDGTKGRWSPKEDYVVTWDIVLKGSYSRKKSGACYVWKLDNVRQSKLKADFSQHRLRAVDPRVLRCPHSGEVFWADFLPKLYGKLGVATCVISESLKITLWDAESGYVVHSMNTGIGRNETRLTDVQAWDDQWIRIQRSYGLGLISVSRDGRWLGMYSSDARKGFIWDGKKGTEVLRFTVPDKFSTKGENSTPFDMDMYFSSNGNGFLLCNEETMLLWLTPMLSEVDVDRGVHTLALTCSDRYISSGQVVCMFSFDGNMVGVCRAYSLVMSVWNLSKGKRHSLLLADEVGLQDEQDAEEFLKSVRGDTHATLSRKRASAARAEAVAGQSSRFCRFNFSQDGKRIVTCMADLSVLLWEIDEGEEILQNCEVIASLRSKYFPAWAVCFSVDPSGNEIVVVCEDTGVLVWIKVSSKRTVARRHGSGLRSCRFSADGKTGVLMHDYQTIHVWDLVNRRQMKTVDFNIPLGPIDPVPFTHNISITGRNAFVGLRRGSSIDDQGSYLTCGPDTIEEDLKDLEKVPANVCPMEDEEWVVVSQFVDIRTPPSPFEQFDFPELFEKQVEGSQLGQQEPPLDGMGLPNAGGSSDTPKVRGEHDRYPASFDFHSPEKWEYLWSREDSATNTTQTLTVLKVNSGSTIKVVHGEDLKANKFIATSQDGRRIACLAEDGRLFVWNPFATEGCLPDWHDLLVSKIQNKQKDISELLDIHGPGILNMPDYRGFSIPLHVVVERDEVRLKCIVDWAVEHGVKMNLCGNYLMVEGGEKQVSTALDVAIFRRTPECIEILLKALLKGLTTEVATAEIYKQSLIPLANIYPSAFENQLSHEHLMFNLPTIKVPERAFRSSDFKVTTSNTMLPARDELQKMWIKSLEHGTCLNSSAEGTKMIAAIPKVVPFPDAANIGKLGLLHPLAMKRRLRNNVFSSFVIKAIIHVKWKAYGRRLLIEEMWHYSLLWLCYTTYALTIGCLWELLSFKELHTARSYDETYLVDPARDRSSDVRLNITADIFLVSSWVLAVLSLIRGSTKLWNLWLTQGTRGLLYWSRSFWNWLELFAYMILIFAIAPLHFGIAETNVDRVKKENFRVGESFTTQHRLTELVAIESILVSWKMLHFAQGFRLTAPIVIMIREIVKEILLFLFIAFGLLFGFAIAFFVLFRVKIHSPCCDNWQDCQDSDDQREANCCEDVEVVHAIESKKLFGDVGLSMVTTFGMMLGETQLESLALLAHQGFLRFVGTIMYILYLLAMMIVLLNLLIAVMGDSFDRVKNTEELHFMKGRAQVIDDVETMMSEEKRDAYSYQLGRYLHVLVPRSREECPRSEWKGRLREMQKLIKNEMGSNMQNVQGELQALRTQYAELARRVSSASHHNEYSWPGLTDPHLSSNAGQQESPGGEISSFVEYLEMIQPRSSSSSEDSFTLI
ncbi:hypothetical protein BSKO_04277 [Bryopsis sp. KO-2023]|nr:hypothetical protein BSKO_04277 [Bryopsis sp. KO-2023]